MVASSLIGAAVCLLVTVFGTMEVVTSLQRGIRIPAEIEIPRAVNLIVIPIGFLCLTLQFLRRAIDGLMGAEPRPLPPASSV
jgi:C4-dicarboxylate transporter DctQ subunit